MAEIRHVDPDQPEDHHLYHAVDVLRDGGVIIYPTDTIYGIGCNITFKEAIDRIRQLKGRDANNPMAFVCSDLDAVSKYAYISNYAFRILARFLPGPFTFVLPPTEETPAFLHSKENGVGIRIPNHPIAQRLATELDSPILSTSANRSQKTVLTTPEQLKREFGSQVDLILECGELPILPSTVVSLLGDKITLLREGQGEVDFFKHQMEAS